MSDCELCHSISKPIGDKEDTLKSFMAFDITPHRPIFRVVVGSKLWSSQQYDTTCLRWDHLMTPISFWCRRELNPKSLTQPLEILPVELTKIHYQIWKWCSITFQFFWECSDPGWKNGSRNGIFFLFSAYPGPIWRFFFSFLNFFTIFLNFFFGMFYPGLGRNSNRNDFFFFLGPDRPYLAKNEARVTFFI